MAFDNRVKNDPNVSGGSATSYYSKDGNPVSPDIVAQNPQQPPGIKQREVIRWRVPSIGFVNMYINPQQMVISDKKIITKQRTKGGFVIQYYGEDLTNIRLSGHTGSSGVEGIEILRKVYRAEQEAFVKVEEQIADRINKLSTGNTLGGLASDIKSKGLGSAIGGIISDSLGGAQVPPLFPTLGSLANAVELYYQGVVYTGFFESMTVTESVQSGPGVFQYDISFTATNRRGFRENFMPWHRQPVSVTSANGNQNGFNVADNNSVPLNFNDEE